MDIINTSRLSLRAIELKDAPSILMLFNEPDCLKFIGDKQMRTLEDAKHYIVNGPQASYKKNNLGLLGVFLHSGEMVGLCGLLKRDELPHPDLGYAILSKYYRQGYAKESCQAVLGSFEGEKTILALTNPANKASASLLLKLHFKFDGIIEGDSGTGYSNRYILKR